MDSSKQPHISLMISGDSLNYVLEKEELERELFNLMNRCSSVLVFRASPSQKADICKFVKEFSPSNVVTLAIGDGGNDVPMI